MSAWSPQPNQICAVWLDLTSPLTVAVLSRVVSVAQAQLRKARSPAKVLVHPTAGHGGFIADPAYQQRVVDEFATLLLASEGRL